MFFFQQQLSENTCGYRTVVPAYFVLTLMPAAYQKDQEDLLNLTKPIQQER